MKKINISKFITKLSGDAGAVSTSKSVTFNGLNFQMEVSKDGYDCRPRESKSKWYKNTYLIYYIFAIYETISYIITGKAIYGSWYFSIILLVLFLLILLVTYFFNDSQNLRMNHGAEHKVLSAFLNHDLKNVDKYSRFSDGCGGNIYSMMVILMLISPIVKFPFVIFLIYVAIYNNIKPVRMIFFNSIGKMVQYFTTAEPTKEILDNVKMGFEKLILAETIKILEDMLKETNLSNEERLRCMVKILGDMAKETKLSNESSQIGNKDSV